jgi:ankyrin repeat protein
VYQKFVDTLRFDCGEILSSPKVDRHSKSKSLELFLSKPSVQTWKEASSTATIHLILGERMTFEDFSHSFLSHVTTADQEKESIILRLGPNHPCGSLSTVHQLYASLCLQLLEQHPSLILWIRHLYPNLRDAILGVDGRWKSRVLTRCLRTLLLIPKRGATYCLIYHTSDGSRKDVIDEILAVTKESEIPFRLLVSTSQKGEIESIADCDCIDLSLEDGMVEMGDDRESTLQGPTEDQSSELWANMFARNLSNSATCGGTPDGGMAISQTKPTLPSNSNRILVSPEQMLSTWVDNGMTWVLRAMAWVSFAIRPLSRIEMEQVLEVLCAEERSIPVEMQRGKILLRALELSLPGLLSIAEDAVWVTPNLRPSLSSIWAKHLSDSPTPELYISRACFAMTAAHFQERSPTTTNHPESEIDASADSVAPAPSNSNSAKSQQQGILPPQHTAGQVIVKYANRYWMEHHLRATLDVSGADDLFRQTLDTSPHFDRNAWIQHLASLYWSPDIGEGLRTKVQPNAIQQNFELSLFDACYISFRMATLPIAIEDDFDWLLLGIASKRMPETAYFNIILKVRETLSDTSLTSTLQRVVAAASVNLRERLFKEFDSVDFLRNSFVEILLTSIAIGNTSAATDLLDMTLSYSLGHKQQDAVVSSLGTALQVACEYGDSDVVKKILQFEGAASPFHLEGSYPWNALHVACHQGYSSLVEDLVESLQGFENKNRTLDAGPPSQFNLLLITSARGLFTISKLIERLGVKAPADEDNCMSATQLASKYGFLKTLDSLLSDHSCKFSMKSDENSALCLAVKSGNDKFAAHVFWAFAEAFEEAYNKISTNHHNDDGDDNDSDSNSDMGDEAVKDSLLVAAKEIIGKALVAAVECGMESIFWLLMPSSTDSKPGDAKGRTPLMLAARIGSVAVTEQLYEYAQGDEVTRTDNTGWSAMHYACYHGHLAVAESLAQHGSVFTAQDDQSATPITAAAIGGHLEIVKLLLHRLSDEGRKAEFILAAKNGLERVLELILKSTTDIDPKARDEYVNAKGEGSNTPLHYAAESNYARVVRFLLLRGANIDALNKAAVTPLANAAFSSSLDSMKLLLDAGASTETPTRRKRSVLTEAILYEQEAAVKLLLEYGASIHLPDYWSYHDSLLDFTIAASTPTVLEVLLKHFDKARKLAAGGPLPEGIPTPTEALQIVIKKGSAGFFNVLVQVWDDFDPVISESGLEIGSIFKYAARYGSVETLERIWERSQGQIDVNEIGGYYGTALQAALVSEIDTLAKINMLIGWGAWAGSQSVEGEKSSTPTASDSSGVDDTNLLHGYWGTTLHAAAISGDNDIVQTILGRKGVSKDQPDRMGRLPLHLATLQNSWEFMKEFLGDKSTITSEDRQGRNALHMACSAGRISIVEEILKDKELVDLLINKADVDGWTPLHWACRSRESDLVELLIDKGARVDNRTSDLRRWLPYHVAVYHG